ncbi:MAG: phenylalanine--tRNA ligase subunit alpha, partial [Bryobacteraceae bacterium]|nr:phenylalanine--tRNA ligase subunit alpha [Bryobacteraceae bacterium]
MIPKRILELRLNTHRQIESASDLAELEAVRIEVLGRKGALTNFSK